jgi:hypothetical protein
MNKWFCAVIPKSDKLRRDDLNKLVSLNAKNRGAVYRFL